MKTIRYHRVEPLPVAIRIQLTPHDDTSGDYDRCIKHTRHDIEIARINYFHFKQEADARTTTTTRLLKKLETESRTADKNSGNFRIIELEKRMSARITKADEDNIAKAHNIVDKLVQQLAKLQHEQEKQKIQDELKRLEVQKQRAEQEKREEQKKVERQKKRALRRKEAAESQEKHARGEKLG